MTFEPFLCISISPFAPSEPMPVRITPTAFEPDICATVSNKISAAGRTPFIRVRAFAALQPYAYVNPRGRYKRPPF
jgi:hypothetical protein